MDAHFFISPNSNPAKDLPEWTFSLYEVLPCMRSHPNAQSEYPQYFTDMVLDHISASPKSGKYSQDTQIICAPLHYETHLTGVGVMLLKMIKLLEMV